MYIYIYIMTEVYYGVRPTKQGQKPPTMQQSINAKQVRYWGLYKINHNLIFGKEEEIKKQKQNAKIKKDALKKAFTLLGTANKLQKTLVKKKKESEKDFLNRKRETENEIYSLKEKANKEMQKYHSL